MTSPTQQPRSRAVKATWVSLGLAFGCGLVFLIGQVVNQIAPFEQTPRGLLVGFLPRAGLYILWAGEALAVIAGLASLLLIRRADITSKAVIGIVAGSLCGIAAGLFGTVFFWLIVGHIVIGF
ncbi:MAG: hypothetical protein IAG10_10995 [Planctomycetaceae bacterium]|nr:hypothetical protein [Planctomycetaceae bacterium]